MKNFLSDHAKIRLAERSRLPEEDLLRLLNGEYSVTVSVQPGSSRLLKLIYSEPDAAHLVVVHDTVTGGVVTILHLDYEGDRVWRATKKELKLAKRLAATLPGSRIGKPVVKFLCHLVVIWLSSDSRTMRSGGGTHRFEQAPRSAEYALGDAEFVRKLLIGCQERKIPLEAVEEIILLDKDQHLVVKIPWNLLDNFRDDAQICDESVASDRRP